MQNLGGPIYISLEYKAATNNGCIRKKVYMY